jgi:septal ring factor EnvC (AmiA/AmiB activator)
MRQYRVILAACLLAAVAAPAALAQRPNITQQIRQNRDRLESIRQERERLETELTRLRSRVHSISGELQNIEQQKGVTSRIVNELDRQIAGMNAQLDTVTLDVMLAQDALAERRAVLDTRLVEIYKRGTLWIFEVLLAAESFGDLMSRYKYLYLVSRQDRALVGQVEELRDRVSQQREHLISLHTELSARRGERGDELQRFVSLERRRQRALRETEASRQAATTRLDSLARDAEQLTQMIAELEAARRRALARGGAPAEGTIDEADLGALDWPVDGDLVYEFGVAAGPDDTRIRFQGVGIAAPVGTPVHAVAAGVVEIAGLMGTYGPTVLLSHGGGFYTLYLRLSGFEVNPGDWVEGGQVIGRSGGAGSEHGPHLGFQIRQAAGESTQPIALDPENWLRRKRPQ